jgi:hypothetical protein
MSKALCNVGLLFAIFVGVNACAGDDGPPERYRSVGERERKPSPDPEPQGMICGDRHTSPGVDGVPHPCAQDIPASNTLAALDLDEVTVIIGAPSYKIVIPWVEADELCGDARAWHYDEADDPSQIVLCPAACTLAMSDPDAAFETFFGCGLTCYESDAGCESPLI